MYNLEKISYTTSSGKILLDAVSARIKTGAMTAIMGLNGAGKTTLLKVLSGIYKASSGQVHLQDKSIDSYAPKELARSIAFVPQDFPTEFPYTVFEFVLMGRYAWHSGWSATLEDHRIARDTLTRLELSGFASRLISSLSGGERQRVLLARALVQNTPIILLDEPLNHLDIKNRLFVLELLKRENHEHGKTIIAVMHDFGDVRKYFSETILLKQGRVAFAGTTITAFEKQRLQNVFEIEMAVYSAAVGL